MSLTSPTTTLSGAGSHHHHHPHHIQFNPNQQPIYPSLEQTGANRPSLINSNGVPFQRHNMQQQQHQPTGGPYAQFAGQSELEETCYMDANMIDENLHITQPSRTLAGTSSIDMSNLQQIQPLCAMTSNCCTNLHHPAQTMIHPHEQFFNQQQQRALLNHQQQQQQQQQQQHQHQQQHLHQQLSQQPHRFQQSPQPDSPGNNYVSGMDVSYDTHPKEVNYSHSSSLSPAPVKDQIIRDLHTLMKSNYSNEEVLRSTHNKQEEIVCQILHGNRLSHQLHGFDARVSQGQQIDQAAYEKLRQEMKHYQEAFKRAVVELRETRKNIIANQLNIMNRLTEIKQEVIAVNLKKWIYQQQRDNINNFSSSSGIVGTPSSSAILGRCQTPAYNHQLSSLDRIEVQVQLMLDVALFLKKQVYALHNSINNAANPNLFNVEELTELRFAVEEFIEDVILNSFVVEKQPPQVMKTNTRFTASCRFLCGSKFNTVASSPPQVKVMILSESNARNVIKRHKELIESSRYHLNSKSDSHINPSSQSKAIKSAMSQQLSMFESDPLSPQSPSVQNTESKNSPEHDSFQYQPQYSSAVKLTSANQDNGSTQSHRQLKALDLSQFKSSGEILNNTNLLELQETTNHVTCNFRNMQLKKIIRTEKKGTESVMDEKFILLFSAEFRTLSNATDHQRDNYFHIMAFSLPVVVIVHGNQEPHAWATVTWHNAFATPDDLLYVVPERVTWRELGRVLSDKFRDCAGRGLNPQNLDYLAVKICRNSKSLGVHTQVSWSQFAKEPLPDRSFTFWEWFHSILKLTKEHLRNLWAAEKIYGFIGKSGCLRLFSEESIEIGTFLLRYSETELGGITIAWLSDQRSAQTTNHSPESQSQSPTYGFTPSGSVVCHVHPYTGKDLNTRPLADRIRDLGELSYLYPNIPKDEAFEDYYSPLGDNSTTSNGYIKPILVQLLPTNYPQSTKSPPSNQRQSRIQQNDSSNAPATPGSSMSSPDGVYHDSNFAADMDTGLARIHDS